MHIVFLDNIFQAVIKNDDLTSILKANQDQLNPALIDHLKQYTAQLLELNHPQEKIANFLFQLGNEFLVFPFPNRRLYLEIAKTSYELALNIYQIDNFREKWAQTKMNLATTYCERIEGERNNNLKKAITYYQEALIVRTYHDLPDKWATTQTNLGNAYCETTENRAENLELAIKCYENALLVRTPHQAQKWASTQHNLATAYLFRIKGNKSENLEKAIAHYENALSILTKKLSKLDWAQTKMNLGTAYYDRINEKKEDNLAKAIASLEEALTVYTYEKFPIQWSLTKMNLANAYRKSPEIAKNLELAVTYYREALTIQTPAQLPSYCRRTAKNLGNLAFNHLQNWNLAIEAYSIAIEAIEENRSFAVTQKERERILEESLTIYQNIIQACINQGELPLAIKYLEKLRSQKLVDLIATSDMDIDNNTAELLKKFLTLQKQIDLLQSANSFQAEKRNVNSANSINLIADNQQIKNLQQERDQVWNEIKIIDPETAANLKNSAPDLTTIQQLITNPNTAILSFYTTKIDTYIFIIRQNSITYHPTQNQNIQDWILEQWLTPYKQNNSQWNQQIPKFLNQLGSKLRLAELIKDHLTNIKELILIPYGYLHFIPLGSIPLNYNQNPTEYKQVLFDKFLIHYIPSCQVLQFCKKRNIIDSTIYGTAENSNNDLCGAQLEGEYIAQEYNIPPDYRLIGVDVTLANYQQILKRVHVMVSSHHAEYRIDNPLESRLLLADGSLTLYQILLWRYPNLQEVFLNNCESGMAKVTSLTDDPLSLAFGFSMKQQEGSHCTCTDGQC